MYSFRLITEGVTDQITLETILSIFYKDPNIDVEPLQPPGDETDRYTQKDFGGWEMIFRYLQSVEFKEAIPFADYFIIQIDTDVSPQPKFGISHWENGRELTPEELYKRVKEKLISSMDRDFYGEHKDKFIFAISIHSIECWFLPLYYDDKRKSKLIHCLDTLNQKLRKEGFTIDSQKKKSRYYETISKKFKTRENLVKLAGCSPSFKMFLRELPGY